MMSNMDKPIAGAGGVPSAIPVVVGFYRPEGKDRACTTRRPRLAGQLHMKGFWEDVGALKAWLRDDLVGERNSYAREVVKDVKARRRETEARP